MTEDHQRPDDATTPPFSVRITAEGKRDVQFPRGLGEMPLEEAERVFGAAVEFLLEGESEDEGDDGSS